MKVELLVLSTGRRYDSYIYKGVDKSAREGARRGCRLASGSRKSDQGDYRSSDRSAISSISN
jgi:hypothetical protein